jgi:pimeloyl-ACP methyl ester carboxylesterase
MSPKKLCPTVVLVHGAWADGSSWSQVITALQNAGTPVAAAPSH